LRPGTPRWLILWNELTNGIVSSSDKQEAIDQNNKNKLRRSPQNSQRRDKAWVVALKGQPRRVKADKVRTNE
jgi:hypothetical protein